MLRAFIMWLILALYSVNVICSLVYIISQCNAQYLRPSVANKTKNLLLEHIKIALHSNNCFVDWEYYMYLFEKSLSEISQIYEHCLLKDVAVLSRLSNNLSMVEVCISNWGLVYQCHYTTQFHLLHVPKQKKSVDKMHWFSSVVCYWLKLGIVFNFIYTHCLLIDFIVIVLCLLDGQQCWSDRQ